MKEFAMFAAGLFGAVFIVVVHAVGIGLRNSTILIGLPIVAMSLGMLAIAVAASLAKRD